MVTINYGSNKHRKVLQHIRDYIIHSEQTMSTFHGRWRRNEAAVKNYMQQAAAGQSGTVDEDKLRLRTEEGIHIDRVEIPYCFAAIQTITAYLQQVFLSRDPVFGIDTYSGLDKAEARNLEKLIQYQIETKNLGKEIRTFIEDCLVYGVGIMRCGWITEQGLKLGEEIKNPLGGDSLPASFKKSANSFEGNEIICINPKNFFPDISVPFRDVAKRGRYVFWRTLNSYEELISQGDRFMNLKMDSLARTSTFGHQSVSEYNSENSPYSQELDRGTGTNDERLSMIQIDTGFVRLIPSMWDLGTSEEVEMWQFVVANKEIILQAEKIDYAHGEFPLVVTQPFGNSNSLGSAGLVDMLSPLQDVLSWMVNSRVENVAQIVNGIRVVRATPGVDMSDLTDTKTPGGTIIARYQEGVPLDDIFKNITIPDVTQGHITDINQMLNILNIVAGVSTTTLGQPVNQGRKTGGEIRTAVDSSLVRLSLIAKNISEEAMLPLSRQVVTNTLQFVTDEFCKEILGKEKQNILIRNMKPRVWDGTLPENRDAVAQKQLQVLQIVAQSPDILAVFDMAGFIKELAKNMGVSDIGQFFNTQVAATGPNASTPGAVAGDPSTPTNA